MQREDDKKEEPKMINEEYGRSTRSRGRVLAGASKKTKSENRG